MHANIQSLPMTLADDLYITSLIKDFLVAGARVELAIAQLMRLSIIPIVI